MFDLSALLSYSCRIREETEERTWERDGIAPKGQTWPGSPIWEDLSARGQEGNVYETSLFLLKKTVMQPNDEPRCRSPNTCRTQRDMMLLQTMPTPTMTGTPFLSSSNSPSLCTTAPPHSHQEAVRRFSRSAPTTPWPHRGSRTTGSVRVVPT